MYIQFVCVVLLFMWIKYHTLNAILLLYLKLNHSRQKKALTFCTIRPIWTVRYFSRSARKRFSAKNERQFALRLANGATSSDWTRPDPQVLWSAISMDACMRYRTVIVEFIIQYINVKQLNIG